MHHAYPNECPYPHEAGLADPSSPEQWMGAEVSATEEEIQQHIDADSCEAEQAALEWEVEVPWSQTEELLPHHHTSGDDAAEEAVAAPGDVQITHAVRQTSGPSIAQVVSQARWVFLAVGCVAGMAVALYK